MSTKRFHIQLLAITTIVLAIGFGRSAVTSSSRRAVQPQTHQELQDRILLAVANARRAVVSINHGATGTIVSADGLVLSQSHVTNKHFNGRTPLASDTELDVVLHDGSVHVAKLVADSPSHDVSLIKIQAAGPFSFLPFDATRTVKSGDYVLKLGHPAGYDAKRGMVTRLGRVVCDERGYFATDCLIQGGDSGGPFVDLDGNFVGMVSHSVGLIPGSDVPYELADAIRASRSSPIAPPKGDNQRSRLLGAMMMRFTPSMELEPCLKTLQGGKHFHEPKAAQRDREHWRERDVKGIVHCLAPSDWINGQRHIDRFTGVGGVGSPTFPVKQRVVQFLDQGMCVCHGFVIDSHGTIVTRGSTLTPTTRCRHRRNGVFDIEVLSTHDDFDLAFVRAEGLVQDGSYETNTQDLPVGTLLLSVSTRAQASSVGIVSVALRHQNGPFPPPRRPIFDGDASLYDEASGKSMFARDFPAFIDTDLHLYIPETGQPVTDIKGKLVGIAIATSPVGARIVPWAEVEKLRLK